MGILMNDDQIKAGSGGEFPSYDDLRLGDSASMGLLVSGALVEKYAALIGDTNPVHLDDEFAAKSFFHRRVAHGMIAAGLISAVLGTRLPGPGAIYLNQSLDFKRPVYLDETIQAKVEITELFDKHKKVTFRTWVENSSGQVVLDGQAQVLVR